MPNPTASDVHVNALLTNLSVAYIQGADAFVSDRVFPRVPVTKQSDYYMSYDKADWLRVKAEKRAPAAESAGGGFGIKTDNTYFCDIWAFHQDIDDQTRANADSPLDLDRDATEYVTRQILLAREQDWVGTFLTTGVWATDYTPTTKWDATDGDPIGDVQTGVDTIEAATGYRPNVLVMSPDVYSCLKNHSDILERIKYTQRGVVTTELLAGLFDLERVLVARAVIDTTAEGASESPGFLVSDKALLCHAEGAPGLRKPSAGYTFTWSGLLGAGAYGARIKRFRIEEREADRIEGEIAFDHKVIASDLGYFFNDVLT